MLLSSSKFGAKVKQVIEEGLAAAPKHVKLEKRFGGEDVKGEVTLEDFEEGKGGMMLYTSGTTNRPVSFIRISRRIRSLMFYRKEYYSPKQ